MLYEQKRLESSRKFSVCYLEPNLLEMFWKMRKFEYFMTQVTKSKYQVKNVFFYLL